MADIELEQGLKVLSSVSRPQISYQNSRIRQGWLTSYSISDWYIPLVTCHTARQEKLSYHMVHPYDQNDVGEPYSIRLTNFVA